MLTSEFVFEELLRARSILNQHVNDYHDRFYQPLDWLHRTNFIKAAVVAQYAGIVGNGLIKIQKNEITMNDLREYVEGQYDGAVRKLYAVRASDLPITNAEIEFWGVIKYNLTHYWNLSLFDRF